MVTRIFSFKIELTTYSKLSFIPVLIKKINKKFSFVGEAVFHHYYIYRRRITSWTNFKGKNRISFKKIVNQFYLIQLRARILCITNLSIRQTYCDIND